MLLILPLIAQAQNDWSSQTSNTSNNLNSIFFVDGTTGWAVGENGTILRTADAGITWNALEILQFSGIQEVEFTSTSRGWIVNDQGEIYLSNNGGSAWERLLSGSPLFGLSVPGTEFQGEEGYAVGDLGRISSTVDGENWEDFQNIPTSNKLLDVFFPNAHQGWAVGTGGTIVFTNDRSDSWSPQSAPAGVGNLNSVHFITREHGIAVGDGGKIIKTTNRGSSWTEIPSSTTENLNGVFFTSETNVRIVGNNGTSLVSTDGGESWVSETIPGAGSTNFSSLYFVRNDLGWVAGDNGKIFQFRKPTVAKVQMVHNAADPALNKIDIYVGSEKTLDDFEFRKATASLEIEAEVELIIAIAPGSSTSAADAIKTFPVNLEPEENYLAMAVGVQDANGFQNPGFTDITLDLVLSKLEQAESDPGFVQLLFAMGSTNLPRTEIRDRNEGNIIASSLDYKDVTEYSQISPSNLIMDLGQEGDEAINASYHANFENEQGKVLTIIGSGFLDPANNKNGPQFGLFAVSPDGSVTAFPQINTALLQIIHSSADTASSLVDIYIDENKWTSGFPFKEGTEYFEVPAAGNYEIGGQKEFTLSFAPNNSGSSADAFVSETYEFIPGDISLAILHGVGPGHKPNPDAKNIEYMINLRSEIDTVADGSIGEFEFIPFNGVTDASIISIQPRKDIFFANDLEYGFLEDGFSTGVVEQSFVDILDANSGDIMATFAGQFDGFEGEKVVLFASGFLDTSPANKEGPFLALTAVTTKGQQFDFDLVNTASIQLIHNVGDPSLSTADIYRNTNNFWSLWLDDIAFRSGIAFTSVPIDEDFQIAIAPGNSTSVGDTITSFPPLKITAGNSQVMVLNGVNNTSDFAANPNAIDIGLSLKDLGSFTGSEDERAEVFLHHGATDVPGINIVDISQVPIVSSFTYTDITEAGMANPKFEVFYVINATDNSDTLATLSFDFSLVAGKSATVFASGFKTPSGNQNGEAFNLVVVDEEGVSYLFQTPDLLPPSNLVTTEVSHNKIDLSWTDNETAPNEFVLERSDSRDFVNKTDIAIGTDTTVYSDSEVDKFTTYFYRVKGVKQGATDSGYSNIIEEMTPDFIERPTVLSATVQSKDEISLRWIDKSDNETGFVLQRSEADDFVGVTPINIPANTETYSDLDLFKNTQYYYRIKAVNENTSSEYSNSADGTTKNFVEAPSNLVAAGSSPSIIRVTWVDNSDNEKEFRLEKSANADFSMSEIISIEANITSYDDEGVDVNIEYFYRIFAVAEDGTSSSLSNTAGSKSKPAPAPPSQLKGEPLSNSEIKLSWIDNEQSANEFALERAEIEDFTGKTEINIPTDQTTYTDTNLSSGTLYYYRVKATLDEAPDSQYSNTIAVGTDSKVETPVELEAFTIAHNQIDIVWKDISDNEDGFILERSENEDMSDSVFIILERNTASYQDKTPAKNTTHYYRVLAFDSNTVSGYSNVGNATTPDHVNAPGSLLAEAATASTMDISWEDNSENEDGFRLQRDTSEDFSGAVTIEIGKDTESHSDQGLEKSTKYYYRIIAYNNNVESAYSNSSSASTNEVLIPPSELKVEPTDSTTVVDISWKDNSNDEEKFVLERSINENDFVNVTSINVVKDAVSYSDSELEAGSTYWYRIKAIKGTLSSSYSNPDSASIEFDDVTALIDEIEPEIAIYPNPSLGSIVFLKYDRQVNEAVDFQIVSYTGQVVKQFKNLRQNSRLEFELESQDLKSGIYFIEFNTDKVHHLKLIRAN